MRILVAGAGNVFLGDDGFGVEVVQRLSRRDLPEGVRLMDVGIRGVHLAYELLDGYDVLILIDAVTHSQSPGTVTVFDRGWEDGSLESFESGGSGGSGGCDGADAHDLDPESVLSLLARLGGRVERILTVGCQPSSTEEQMGLSASVEAAVEPAAEAVLRLIERIRLVEADSSVRPSAVNKGESSRCSDAS